MDYEIKEINELNIYTAELLFKTDIIKYLDTDDFKITFADVYMDDEFTITKDNWRFYGLIQVEDKSKQVEESLFAHDGILIYFPSNTKMVIKILPLCSNDKQTIGRGTSRIYVNFDYNNDFSFYANIYPKIIRNNTITQNFKQELDPILPEIDIRPAYDYDIEIKENSIISNFIYDSTNSLYVNTTATVQTNSAMIPMYISTLSAYTFNNNDYEFDFDSASSYLHNNLTNVNINIPYEITNSGTTAVNIISNYFADVKYYEIVQKIYTQNIGRYSEEMIYYLPVKEKELEYDD